MGSIPDSIGGLTSLRRLFLTNNQLSGPIPVNIKLVPNIIIKR